MVLIYLADLAGVGQAVDVELFIQRLAGERRRRGERLGRGHGGPPPAFAVGRRAASGIGFRRDRGENAVQVQEPPEPPITPAWPPGRRPAPLTLPANAAPPA